MAGIQTDGNVACERDGIISQLNAPPFVQVAEDWIGHARRRLVRYERNIPVRGFAKGRLSGPDVQERIRRVENDSQLVLLHRGSYAVEGGGIAGAGGEVQIRHGVVQGSAHLRGERLL